MRRWLPYPSMSVFILAAWLLLNQSLAAGHLLSGAAFALILPVLLRRLDLPTARVSNPHLIIQLAGRVAWDIVRSNVAVFLLILGGRDRRLHSGFVRVPLLLTDPYGLAILSTIITSTPGTLWVSYESKQSVLLIHVFDLVDEAEWVRNIVDRYELPLRRIFE